MKDWDGSVLREGNNGWSCYPGPEHMPNSPMCLDAVWEKWAPAWANKKPFKTDKLGIAYMLMGDDVTEEDIENAITDEGKVMV